MKNKKKIALVIPSLHAGGMERVMSELANYFSEKDNIIVHLIILGKSNKFYDISNNVIIHEPNFLFNNSYRLLYILKTMYFLRSTIKKIKPYSVLSFGEMYNSFVLIALKFLNCNIYVSDRSKPDKKWGRVHDFLRKKLYKNATGIISQTSYSKVFLQKITNNKNIVVIPNPVISQNEQKNERKNIILSVGRLIYSKRLDLLLKMFSEIENQDYELWIVGDGIEKDNLVKLAHDLMISEKVIFWGARKDIHFFYKQAKIFAFTSVSEGFPNALLEALSFGLPSIAFDCIAGPSDLIIDGYNGFLITELDQKTYKEKLIELMDDNVFVKLAKNTQKHAGEFDIEKIGQKYLDTLLS